MQGTEINKLWEQLLRQFRDFYRYTDKAHRIDHITNVKSNAIRIAFMLGKTEHLKLALIAVAAHDIFSTKEDRASHHIKAYNWVLDNKPVLKRKYKLTDDDCLTIAHAVLEHRSSHKGNYNGIVSEIVAAADRGIPSVDDVTNYMHRSYLFAREQGKSVTDSKFHAVRHVQDKFGMNGKSNVPEWYGTLFAERILERRDFVEQLDNGYFTQEIIDDLESRLTHE
ncbi:putative HD domain protein [Salmonella phage SPAsTU]|nr:putative HD domain protein [Salmonella phage SPAsTU]